MATALRSCAACPPAGVDFIHTDPPYITRYKGRDDRTVPNDDNAAWLAPSAAQMFRLLKNDAFAVSFYGWTRTDLFFDAWRAAGFRIAAHLVFHKRYTSKKAYFAYRHESAFLLIKGNPTSPAALSAHFFNVRAPPQVRLAIRHWQGIGAVQVTMPSRYRPPGMVAGVAIADGVFGSTCAPMAVGKPPGFRCFVPAPPC